MLSSLIHYKELKIRFYYASFCYINTFIFSYVFASQLIRILSKSFTLFVEDYNFDFIITNIFEALNTYIVLSFHVSFFFIIPILYYFLFSFLKPGLFSYEKQFLIYTFKILIIYLTASFSLCYYILIPCFLSFLLELTLINKTDLVVLKNNIVLYDFIIFTCEFFFTYCYFVFQIPTLISICIFFKQLNPISFFKVRRLYLILSLFFGSVLSSSEFLNFLFVSIILFMLFEVFALLSVFKNRYLYVK